MQTLFLNNLSMPDDIADDPSQLVERNVDMRAVQRERDLDENEI